MENMSVTIEGLLTIQCANKGCPSVKTGRGSFVLLALMQGFLLGVLILCIPSLSEPVLRQ